jgi:single-stranded DNA-binding protein
VVLSGVLAAASLRTIGHGRTLVDLRLAVTRPARKGEGTTREVIPITLWAGDVGAAVLGLAAGTPLVVLGRVSAREWTSPSGAVKTFLEVVGERVTVDVEALGAEPRAVGSPADPAAREPDAVPF